MEFDDEVGNLGKVCIQYAINNRIFCLFFQTT